MLSHLITFVMRQRALVLMAALILIGIGVFSALRLPIDAVPDITNIQVQVNTPVDNSRRRRSKSSSPFPSKRK